MSKQLETTPNTGYEPTVAERKAVDEHFERKARKRPLPKMTLETNDGVGVVTIDHPDERVAQTLFDAAFGSTSRAFTDGLMRQVLNISPNNDDEGWTNDANFMLAAITDIEPKDHMEAMLATQMAAVHMATMKAARLLSGATTIPQADSAEKQFNKLTRTFTAQMEALKKYRTGGEQKMTVEHVTVNEGGQAIVGNVQGARQKKRKATS